jgi:hypothetical protein
LVSLHKLPPESAVGPEKFIIDDRIQG